LLVEEGTTSTDKNDLKEWAPTAQQKGETRDANIVLMFSLIKFIEWSFGFAEFLRDYLLFGISSTPIFSQERDPGDGLFPTKTVFNLCLSNILVNSGRKF
jgi:hypothetical protein